MTGGTEIEPKVQTDVDPGGNRSNGACSPSSIDLLNGSKNTTAFQDLPKDVLCEFIHKSIGEDANTLERLVPLMAVSSGLRSFINGTPRFWNVIGSMKPELILRALERSVGLPLKIYIEAKDFSPDIREALVPQSHRIAVLSFLNLTSFSINSLTDRLVTPNLHTFHAFQGNYHSLWRGYSPPHTLKNLRLERFTIRENALDNLRTLHLIETSFIRKHGLVAVLEILRGNPNLEALSLEWIHQLREASTELGMIELPNLRFLSLADISSFDAFQTLCSVLHTPNLKTIKLRVIKREGGGSDGSWLSSVLDSGQPFSVFIGRWLQRAAEITLLLSSNTRPGADFDLFDVPGFYLHIGGIPPALILEKPVASYQLESPITLKLAGLAPSPMGVVLPHLGPSIVRLPTLSRLVLREDYMVRNVLTHLSTTQPITATSARRLPCPKLKAVTLPASATMEDTLALDFIRCWYAVGDARAIPVLEQQQTERLKHLGIFDQVGEESAWSAFVDEVGRLTNTRPRKRTMRSLGVRPGDVRAFAYELVPLDTPPPGWSQVSVLGKSIKAIPVDS
ncbi:hypothetical protein FRB94_002875 [Tulasnella sp. JGI-2019a]|nr:hypothetical protein FRB94_002875 [Tulasnella sp. JGI-2019a]